MTTLIDDVRSWRHDLAGCLHACMATLLEHRGVAPLETLGAAWRFRHLPGDIRREEYFYPCAAGESLLGALAPYHPVRSVWHSPADAAEGWAQVRAEVAAGRPVAVAVDNFELPFRPAYRDVHSNHMVIVHGFDEDAGTVHVLDAIPPHFHGDITLQQLTASRDSGNAAVHDRDMFFTDVHIGNRWLSVELDANPEDFPAFDRSHIRDVVERNLRGYHEPVQGDGYAGLDGLTAFFADMGKRLAAGETVRDELFVVAGAALANTAVHADWLALAGRTLDHPGLTEQGRAVERIAHHWSAIRIMAALTQSEGLGAARFTRRAHTLLKDLEQVLAGLAHEGAEL
ncbi:BtrH N-terminal domain-containing protein [Streptomyces olivoreticuli]|uniref:BtrH N-terminal domain-containing protein n=1 Tax=Streptomyces olivoreticuli TaxID=68246 RepID=UPI00265B6B0B|nr:BtrH N-terminal domain-containing protein [Streptomyces olivoreticuli]WKK26820.1 BtrH N-terminal domain-containing protein [Streptomyces olivoreticuli]